jgi:NADPH2:quinone reductase
MPKSVVCKEFGDYNKMLELKETPQLHPGRGEVVVRVLACGLAFPDVLTVLGKHISRPTPPFVLGSEVCGQVVSTDSKLFKVGDLVFGNAPNGGAAQEALLHEQNTFMVPKGVDPAIAAGFEVCKL